MSLRPKIAEMVEQNDQLEAAKAIADFISDMPQEQIEAVLYFALMQSELKGQRTVAKSFAIKAEGHLDNIKIINSLNSI